MLTRSLQHSQMHNHFDSYQRSYIKRYSPFSLMTFLDRGRLGGQEAQP